MLAVLSQTAPDPLAYDDEVEVTGWSADALKVSVRVFDRSDVGEGETPKECPGYLDQNGESFTGRLYLAAYDQGELAGSWLVQDYPQCTLPAQAKATLAAAKAKFAELGINLKSPGTKVPCRGATGCDVGHETRLVVDDRVTTKESRDGMRRTHQGAWSVFLKSAARKVPLCGEKVEVTEEASAMEGSSLVVTDVEKSPKGDALIVRAGFGTVNGRSGISPTKSVVHVVFKAGKWVKVSK
ncbi:MAG: hypothetical protein JNK82_38180 [Myxococcaceae bacterium]|nr:hypothetical protein [Myxococcaceae bacterium]